MRHRRRPRPIASSRDRAWFRIVENKTASEADIHIFDEIGYWGVTASDFTKAIATLDASTLNLHLNSPGGEVFEGIAIFNALVASPAKIVVHVDGIAASIASIIAMAGDEIVMGLYSTMMIHDAMTSAYAANPEELREIADRLDSMSDTLASVYADRSGTDAADWRKLMKAETWFTAEEAVEYGLADRVAEDKRQKVENKFELMASFRYRDRAAAPAPPKISDGSADPHRPAPIADLPSPPEDVVAVATPPAGKDPKPAPRADPAPVVSELDMSGYDPEAMKAALSFGINPPVETEVAPFEFDPDQFRAIMHGLVTDAPAAALHTKPPVQAPTFADAYDPEFFRSLIREAIK